MGGEGEHNLVKRVGRILKELIIKMANMHSVFFTDLEST